MTRERDKLKARTATRLGLNRKMGAGGDWLKLDPTVRLKELAKQRQIEKIADIAAFFERQPETEDSPVEVVKPRSGQAKFRKEVIERDGRCVLTGVPANAFIISKGRRKSLLDAAHIKPVSLCRGDEYWDVNNGLTMRADIHKAFDSALFTILDDGTILPSRFMEDIYRGLRMRTPPTAAQRHYLAGHRMWCFKNWSRWSFDEDEQHRGVMDEEASYRAAG